MPGGTSLTWGEIHGMMIQNQEEEGYGLTRIDLVQRILREHNKTSVATVNFFEKPHKYAEDDSLYMREVHFVVEIGSMGSPTMSEVAGRLNVTQGAVTQMAIRLEKKGYVFRQKDSQDKRVTTISLTEKGKALCDAHIAFDKREYGVVSESLAEFSDMELEKLIRYEQIMWEIFTKRNV